MRIASSLCWLFILLQLTSHIASAQMTNQRTESYVVPDLLISQRNRKINTVKKWEKIRRPELLSLFQNEVYGKVPGNLTLSDTIVWERDDQALNGTAIRKQIGLFLRKNEQEIYVELLMFLPKNTSNFPLFLGYNFMGNHTISYDPNIRISESWVADNPAMGIIHNQLTEQSRGKRENRWPIQQIIDAGCGIATMYYGDIDPDRPNFSDGVHPLFYKNNETEPAHDEWGSISAWAWGLSKAMDYLQSDKDINPSKVIVFGHSRLGKTALWAAATDLRFAAAISNDSGCGGAALSRRRMGETVAKINSSFPHWFCQNFKKYNNRENTLPVDQHMLLALIAPRPLYVASATEDLWADPEGEFLAAALASPAYQLYGLSGLAAHQMPQENTPVFGNVSYHIRKGKHDITSYDWEQYIHFAKEIIK